MTAMMRRRAAQCLVVGVLLTTSLSGCGGKSTPAICSHVDALKASVTNVTKVPLGRNTLSTLKSGLTKVQADLNKVKAEGQAQFATEIAAVKQAASSVSTSLAAAEAAPSAGTVASVGIALKALGTSLTALENAVTSTC